MKHLILDIFFILLINNSVSTINNITINNVKTLNSQYSVYCLKLFNKEILASGLKNGNIDIWNLTNETIIRSLKSHRQNIWSLQLLNDKFPTLISSSKDKLIKLWNITTGKVVKTLIGHNESVYSLIILTNETIATGSFDNTIRLWNITTGNEIKQLYINSFVFSLILLNDGQTLVSSSNASIIIWAQKIQQ